MFKHKLYLIDAGPNLLYSLTALGISINEIEGIFHTHAHDDHFAGLPTLIRSGKRIKYYATTLVRASVTKKLFSLLSAEEQRFSDFFEVHDLEFDAWTDIAGLDVKPVFSPHPVETNVFFFRTLTDGGYRSYAHLADIISLTKLKGMITDRKAASGISSKLYSQIKETYATPVNLKKVDIGGGMIHGSAVDFRDDLSDKLILSHTERELSNEEKEIGDHLAFGVTDVLISGQADYIRRYAYDFLRSYFTALSRDRLKGLLNNRMINFPPGASILKKGETVKELFLLLTGVVGIIQSNASSVAMLCPGSLIGESAQSNQSTSPATYRAVGFARAIAIPRPCYVEFIKNNALDGKLEELYEKRTFLQKTRLFGEAIAYPTLNKIAQTMQLQQYRAGEVVSKQSGPFLGLVRAGTMERRIGEESFGIVGQYDFFGEESAFFDTPSVYAMSAFDDVSAYRIPLAVFRDIPIVRWKLIEAYEKRRRMVLNKSTIGFSEIHWRAQYNVNVFRMDNQHKRLFELGRIAFETLETEQDENTVMTTVDGLTEFIKFHLEEEEALLKRHHYPDFDNHREQHRYMIRRIDGWQTGLGTDSTQLKAAILAFFKDWLVTHILSEDRKYGEFLNSKGIE
ncbi:MAG: bacteriohemerythrin [Pseudomonadota bacterium]